MHILVDAYNLLFASPFPHRDALIQSVAGYQKRKGHRIQLIFDGTHQGTLWGDRQVSQDIEIVFTPIKETADEWIESYLEYHQGQTGLVVSSDRRVQKAATAAGWEHMNSEHFLKYLQTHATKPISEGREYAAWEEGREDEDRLYQSKSKKGPSRRRSKKAKKQQQKYRKL